MPVRKNIKSVDSVKSNTTKDVTNLRYSVYISEQENMLLIAKLDNLHFAKDLAARYVDDALPYNTVHVIDDVLQKKIGHAYLGGDGGSYWHEEPPKE